MSLLRRKPRGPVRRDPQNPGPDERIFGRHYRGPRPVAIGLVVAILFVVGFYLGFTKRIPFTGRGYELHATLENATTLKPDSPVRIAGVNVGKVFSVEPEGNMAEATFTVSDEGLPIHEDAEIKVRPRLFLEGNFFLDLHPGSPSAPELDERVDDPDDPDDHRRPDRRDPDLAPVGHQDQPAAGSGGVRGRRSTPSPTAAEDAAQDPDVQGLTGAQAINETFRYGGKAGRTSGDRQPGVPWRASARPLRPDPRPARPVHEARLHRRGAERLHHELQHHRRGVRLGVRQPLGLDPRARPHPPGGGALAAPPERRAAMVPQAGARVPAGHPRAPGDDPRRLAVARAGAQAAEAERAGRHRPAARRVGAAPRQGRPRVAEAVPAARPLRPLRLPQPGPRRQHRDRRRRGRLPVQHRPAELPGVLLRRRPAGGREPGVRRQWPLRPLPGRRRPAARADGAPPRPGLARSPSGDTTSRSRSATRPRLPAGGMPPFRMDVPCYTQDVPDTSTGPPRAVGPPSPEAVP